SLRKGRDGAALSEALASLKRAAEDGGNLLQASIVAMRARATVGEVSAALEEVFGRHRAPSKILSGVYGGYYQGDAEWEQAMERVQAFEERHGRRPRLLVAKLGQDGHDRGAKLVATGFADLGFDVDMGSLFQTPAEAAKQAVENDVHILGVSSLAAGHKTLVPQVIEELKKYGREDIMVIVGGVIPTQDYQYLFDAGAVAVFGPGTRIADAAIAILNV